MIQEQKLVELIKKFCMKIDRSIGYPAWHMKYSNTIFFKRPPQWMCEKYSLANGFLKDYGGELFHVVVMQHVRENIIDEFIEDLYLKAKNNQKER